MFGLFDHVLLSSNLNNFNNVVNTTTRFYKEDDHDHVDNKMRKQSYGESTCMSLSQRIWSKRWGKGTETETKKKKA